MTPRKRSQPTLEHTKPSLRFSRINAILLAAGLTAVVVGYVLMAQGSITAAPLLLVLGYAILIPLGLIL